MILESDLRENSALSTEDPEMYLELMYLGEFLKGKGYRLSDLCTLPKEKARKLMVEACAYASMKLAEVESRAKFVQRIRYP